MIVIFNEFVNTPFINKLSNFLEFEYIEDLLLMFFVDTKTILYIFINIIFYIFWLIRFY